ncbi:MAG: hypothetical protein WEB79_00245 [Thermoleophilaceae bacterium]
MPSTLSEVEAICDRHGVDVLDIQRIHSEWSVALASATDDSAERAYAEAGTLSEAVALAASQLHG